MTRTTCVIVFFVALATVALSVSDKPSSSASPSAKVNPTIRILKPEGGVAEVYGPRVLVLICCDSKESVYIQRDLHFITEQPLYATVYDSETGKDVLPRYHVDRAPAPPLIESDFVELYKGCYGPIVDIYDYFQVEAGRRYKVVFTYQSHAPENVGNIKPWQGKISSKTILIEVPKQ